MSVNEENILNEQLKQALLVYEKMYEQDPIGFMTKIIEAHQKNDNFRTFIQEALRDGDKIEKGDDLESLLKSINLEKQVESNKEILLKNGFIGESKDGKMGILDKDKNMLRLNMNKEVGVNQLFSEEFEEDMKECIFPSYEDILKVMNEDPDKYLDGFKKGYTRLLITPYSNTEKEFYDNFTQWHDSSKNLKELGRKDTVWFSERQKEAIENDSILYNPTKVTKNSIEGALSRKEFLKTLKFPGYDVTFVQDILEIPRKGEGKEIGGEKQVECGSQIYTYFNNSKRLKSQRAYAIDFIRRVEEEKKLLNRNTWQVTGNTDGKVVFVAYWDSTVRRSGFGRGYPKFRLDLEGAELSLEVS